jgi:hypothetical protein
MTAACSSPLAVLTFGGSTEGVSVRIDDGDGDDVVVRDGSLVVAVCVGLVVAEQVGVVDGVPDELGVAVSDAVGVAVRVGVGEVVGVEVVEVAVSQVDAVCTATGPAAASPVLVKAKTTKQNAGTAAIAVPIAPSLLSHARTSAPLRVMPTTRPMGFIEGRSPRKDHPRRTCRLTSGPALRSGLLAAPGSVAH